MSPATQNLVDTFLRQFEFRYTEHRWDAVSFPFAVDSLSVWGIVLENNPGESGVLSTWVDLPNFDTDQLESAIEPSNVLTQDVPGPFSSIRMASRVAAWICPSPRDRATFNI